MSRGEEVITTLTVNNGAPHSQTIFSSISTLLEIAGVGIADVDAFAAAAGPGSFTGLRVGLSAVKGLADGLGRPGFGIDSLDLLALTSGLDGAHLVIIDAGRGEVYGGLREVASGEILHRSPVDRVGQPLHVIGLLEQDFKKSALIITNESSSNTPAVLAQRAARMLMSGQSSPIKPHYIRPSDAEVNRK
ncbi:MAG: tRNA (adenosine(37)-N6)-threonylcarbamoyltransferase complex dimerization subunit type 1 TsaB [Gammaproteobacteria bacterium]|nr:tRNA (adenosine(37)-N6)-threonylcarbamoyltransferase complex dimerization subunit type 1 TsaB [Gammaproteobacteria bacterium]